PHSSPAPVAGHAACLQGQERICFRFGVKGGLINHTSWWSTVVLWWAGPVSLCAPRLLHPVLFRGSSAPRIWSSVRSARNVGLLKAMIFAPFSSPAPSWLWLTT